MVHAINLHHVEGPLIKGWEEQQHDWTFLVSQRSQPGSTGYIPKDYTRGCHFHHHFFGKYANGKIYSTLDFQLNLLVTIALPNPCAILHTR